MPSFCCPVVRVLYVVKTSGIVFPPTSVDSTAKLKLHGYLYCILPALPQPASTHRTDLMFNDHTGTGD
jgi:hypothetical protein